MQSQASPEMSIPKIENDNRLGLLHDKYYILFSDLFINRTVMDPKQFDKMSDVLMRAYDRELDYLLDGVILETAQEKYARKLKLKMLVPKKILFFKNRAAKAIRRSVYDECMDKLLELAGSAGVDPNIVPEPMPGIQENLDETALVPSDI